MTSPLVRQRMSSSSHSVQDFTHLQSKPAVQVGQRVAQGDVIGYVGSTGSSTGNHLHFQLLVNGTPVDPLAMLPQ